MISLTDYFYYFLLSAKLHEEILYYINEVFLTLEMCVEVYNDVFSFLNYVCIMFNIY